jgi:hypothetical protein
MKVTSDRIKARAQQLRNNGFKLSGSMVRSTLEMNAGARTLQSSNKETSVGEKEKSAGSKPEKTEAAWLQSKRQSQYFWMNNRKFMPKTERNQNGRSNVRVLHFPATSPSPAPSNGDSDALADSIRKAWTQKSSNTKQAAGSDLGQLRLVNGKI